MSEANLVFRVLRASAESLGVTAPQKAVLVSYVQALNPKQNGTLAWPGLECVAAQTGYDEKTVRRAIERLCELDLIKLQQRTARHKIYSVNVGVINRLIDESGQKVQSVPDEWAESPGRVDSVSPVSGHKVQLTANRTAKGTANLPPIGCSSNLKTGSDPVQRKMALAGIVAGAAESMRIPKQEQPTVEKPDWQEDRRTAIAKTGRQERPG